LLVMDELQSGFRVPPGALCRITESDSMEPLPSIRPRTIEDRIGERMPHELYHVPYGLRGCFSGI